MRRIKKDKEHRSVIPIEFIQFATQYLGTLPDIFHEPIRRLILPNITTDEQVRLLRSIGSVMAEAIAKNVHKLENMKCVLELLIHLYFFVETKPIHKQISWVMDHLVKKNDNLSLSIDDLIHSTFRDCMESFVMKDFFTSDLSSSDYFTRYTQQLEIYEHLIELELFRTDITHYFTETTKRCAHVLNKFLSSVIGDQQVPPQAIFICVGIFKLIHSLSTRNVDAIQQAISENDTSLAKIIESGFRALINSNFPRDAQRIPLLILYKLMDVSFADKSELGDFFLCAYFNVEKIKSEEEQLPIDAFEQELPNIFTDVVIHHNNRLLRAAYSHFTEMGKIAALGSLFHAFSSAVILREIKLCNRDAPFSLLFDGAFPALYQFCSNGSSLFHKLFAAQGIQTVSSQIKDITKEGVSIGTEKRIAYIVKQLFSLVFDNWDNTANNMHEIMRDIFSETLEIQDALSPAVKSTIDIQSYTHFLVNTSWNSKGKYPSLQSLLSKIGSKAIVLASPNIFRLIIEVLGNRQINTQASSLYAQIASGLLKETTQKEWEELILVPIIESLGDFSDQFRRNAIFVYLIPKLIKVNSFCVGYILNCLRLLRNRRLDLEFFGDNYLLDMIQLLHIAKTEGILSIEDYRKSYDVIDEGLINASEDIRLSTFDLIITNTKSTEPPTDLHMLEHFFVLNLKNSGSLFRYNYCSILSRFFKRIRDASYKIYNTYERKKNVSVLFAMEYAKDMRLTEDRKQYHDMMRFLSVITTALQNSIYPGCTHEKLILSIEIYKLIIQTFNNNSAIQVFVSNNEFETTLWKKVDLFSPNLVTTLLNTFLDCWDKVRESLYDLLLLFPSPLPSYDTPELTQQVLKCALKLIFSARQRESDAGALIIRLLLAKYSPLGWGIDDNMNLVASVDKEQSNVYSFVHALHGILCRSTEECTKDLFNITREYALIGPLSSIHNIIKDIDFMSEEKKGVENRYKWKELIGELMNTVVKGCMLAVKVISDMRYEDDESNINVDCRGHVYFDDAEKQSIDYNRVHSLTVNCWLAVKEACTLLGTLSGRVPLYRDSVNEETLSNDCIISATNLRDLGKLFLDILLSTKHCGAIEKSQIGFQDLSKRLLTCDVLELRKLPGQWLDEMFSIIMKQETSILRRSAGVPFCIIALLKAEPQSLPPVLLPRTMKFLYDLASVNNLMKSDEESARKTVHALNIMRSIFHDATFASHITQYIEEAFTCSLNGFSSSNWTVRNSSLMCYTALMQRAIGNYKDKYSNLALTSRDFFLRYPSLRLLLLSQLTIATKDNNLLHPSLYPSLLLLSRLRPIIEEIDDELNNDNVKRMIPFVKQCVNNRHYMARTIAAKALVPLIEKNKVNDFVKDIFQELDLSIGRSANRVHGLLCQLLGFVKEKFEQEWFDMMIARLDFLFIKNKCHISRTVCFKVMNRLLHCMISSRIEVPQEILSRLIDITMAYSIRTTDKQNLGTAIMKEEATTMILYAHLLHGSNLYMADNLRNLISNQSFNVRVSVHKFMIKYKDHISWIHELDNLRKFILIFVLLEETDVHCIRYGLSLIGNLFSSEFLSDLVVVVDFALIWNKLLLFYENTNLYIKEQAIVVMGLVIRGLINTESNVNLNLDIWSGIISQCVQANNTENLRAACQKSIALSNILIYNQSSNAQICAWESCIILLQDEDEEIRKRTVSMISPIISGTETNFEKQVEHVLESCFHYMSQLFQDKDRYIKFLLSFVSIRDLDGQINLNFTQIDEAVLFDKESENIFVEVLFLAQLAAQQVHIITGRAKIHDSYADQLADEMEVVLNGIEKRNNMYYVDDLTNNAQVFLAAYRVALGLRALHSPLLSKYQNRLLQLSSKPNLTLLNVFNDELSFNDLMFTLTQK